MGDLPEDAAVEHASGWALLPPKIQGRGKWEGNPPRGAGIIGICILRGEPHVCLCEKKNGNNSFPKGGACLDEPKFGVRYFLARCEPADPGSGEPDAGRMEWAPPHEDPNYHD